MAVNFPTQMIPFSFHQHGLAINNEMFNWVRKFLVHMFSFLFKVVLEIFLNPYFYMLLYLWWLFQHIPHSILFVAADSWSLVFLEVPFGIDVCVLASGHMLSYPDGNGIWKWIPLILHFTTHTHPSGQAGKNPAFLYFYYIKTRAQNWLVCGWSLTQSRSTDKFINQLQFLQTTQSLITQSVSKLQSKIVSISKALTESASGLNF